MLGSCLSQRELLSSALLEFTRVKEFFKTAFVHDSTILLEEFFLCAFQPCIVGFV